MFKLNNIKIYKIFNSKTILIDDFLKKHFLDKIINELSSIEKNAKDVKSFFLKGKSKKKEYLNFDEFSLNQKLLIKKLSSEKFRRFLKKIFKIEEKIFPDKSLMFSGFNFVEKNGYLRPHVDFNYNNKYKKYRTLNLLLYFNNKWKKSYGGNLSFYNYFNKKKKYEFLAKKNRLVIFLTNKYTPHGYSKITVKQKRVSLNFYYYTNSNFSFSSEPHKTIWH
jgi:Rps23 Pro-64 3,4-dihydroxylase Tpa1-like proline 4-hydroxylase